MKPAALLFIATCLLPLLPGSPQLKSAVNANGPIEQNAALAKPLNWGTASPARMFKDTEMKVNFSLKTSWVPGEGHKGMFRYVMIAAANAPDLYSDEQIETLMKRVHNCSIVLNLQDVDGFELRRLVVPFAYGVDKEARLKSLYANTASQMDANEYRQLVGNPNKSGSWSTSWDCGGEP